MSGVSPAHWEKKKKISSWWNAKTCSVRRAPQSIVMLSITGIIRKSGMSGLIKVREETAWSLIFIYLHRTSLFIPHIHLFYLLPSFSSLLLPSALHFHITSFQPQHPSKPTHTNHKSKAAWTKTLGFMNTDHMWGCAEHRAGQDKQVYAKKKKIVQTVLRMSERARAFISDTKKPKALRKTSLTASRW